MSGNKWPNHITHDRRRNIMKSVSLKEKSPYTSGRAETAGLAGAFLPPNTLTW